MAKRWRVTLTALCLSTVAVLHAQTALLSEANRRAIDRMFAVFDRTDTPGYAIEILKDGKIAYAKGYGMANLDDSVPITPQTIFHLASLSKQFTGAAIALLLLDGKISLEDPVSKYIPETTKYGPELKLKHLVYMTSGLHEYMNETRTSGQPWMTSYYFTRDEAIAAALKPEKLLFAPGSQWEYSNTNYMLLTRIVEIVSSKSFAAFMRDRVFQPLEMTATDVNDDTTLVVAHRAIGYARRDDPQVARELANNGIRIRKGSGWVRLIRNSPHFGGSGVMTSLEDLARWDENWYSGRLGSGFTTQMNQRMTFAHGKDNDAFGLVFHTRYEKTMIDYSGGDTDTSTYMARFPEQHLTVICLSNMPLGDAEGKAKAVLDLLHAAGKL